MYTYLSGKTQKTAHFQSFTTCRKLRKSDISCCGYNGVGADITGENGKYSKYTAVDYLLKIRIFEVILWNILNIPNFLNTLIFKIFHTKYFEYPDF